MTTGNFTILGINEGYRPLRKTIVPAICVHNSCFDVFAAQINTDGNITIFGYRPDIDYIGAASIVVQGFSIEYDIA